MPTPALSPTAAVALPRILEIKRTLVGREKRFECRVLHAAGPHLVVLFVAAEALHVHGVHLPAGTVTFGHFWRDRPYNVYHWLEAVGGRPIGAYVNLSADTRIAGDQLEWLDLVLDVLVLPDEAARVLDEDEVPADTAPAVRAQITAALEVVMTTLPALLDELEQFRARLWPGLRQAASGA